MYEEVSDEADVMVIFWMDQMYGETLDGSDNEKNSRWTRYMEKFQMDQMYGKILDGPDINKCFGQC